MPVDSQSLAIYFSKHNSKSFKVISISQKVDGSENDFLWHQSNEESCQERT
jgi:hypothetical protein